jgi:hypothetical protein
MKYGGYWYSKGQTLLMRRRSCAETIGPFGWQAHGECLAWRVTCKQATSGGWKWPLVPPTWPCPLQVTAVTALSCLSVFPAGMTPDNHKRSRGAPLSDRYSRDTVLQSTRSPFLDRHGTCGIWGLFISPIQSNIVDVRFEAFTAVSEECRLLGSYAVWLL